MQNAWNPLPFVVVCIGGQGRRFLYIHKKQGFKSTTTFVGSSFDQQILIPMNACHIAKCVRFRQLVDTGEAVGALPKFEGPEKMVSFSFPFTRVIFPTPCSVRKIRTANRRMKPATPESCLLTSAGTCWTSPPPSNRPQSCPASNACNARTPYSTKNCRRRPVDLSPGNFEVPWLFGRIRNGVLWQILAIWDTPKYGLSMFSVLFTRK